MRRIFIVLLLLIGALFVFTNLIFPLTLTEVKEFLVAESLVSSDKATTQDFAIFSMGKSLISPAAILFRTVSVGLSDLSPAYVRVPNAVVFVLYIYLLYNWLKNTFNKKWISIAGIVITIIHPLFISTAFFELGDLLGLTFLLVLLNYKHSPLITFSSSILAIFSSIYTVPFVLAFTFLQATEKRIALSVSLILIILLGLVILPPKTRSLILKQSIIGAMLPTSYTHIIDKNLSFGTYVTNPFIVNETNFMRIAHNKPYYALREGMRFITKTFDYEQLTSPLQAGTILSKDSISARLPKYFFWEIPVILMGLIVLLKHKNRTFRHLLIASVITISIFGINGLWLTLPLVIASHLTLLQMIVSAKARLRTIFFTIYALLMLFSAISFIDMFLYHPNRWFSANELTYQQLFSNKKLFYDSYSLVTITDRLGEPAYFYAFYLRPNLDEVIEYDKSGTITKIGTTEFRSFAFSEISHGASQLWVGLPGEFLGESEKHEAHKLNGGNLLLSLGPIQYRQKSFGDMLWMVETK